MAKYRSKSNNHRHRVVISRWKNSVKSLPEKKPTIRITTLKDHAKEIAALAAKEGVIIHHEGDWKNPDFEPLGKRYTLKELQRIVGGNIELVEIPTVPGKKAPTVLVVNDEGAVPGKELPYNPVISAIIGTHLYGDVIWLPRELMQ